MLPSPRTPLAQKSAVSTPHERDRHKYYCKTSEKRSCPLVAQLGEKAMCEQGKARAEEVTDEADSS